MEQAVNTDAGLVNVLDVATPKVIRYYDHTYGNTIRLPSRLHDGLEEQICETASIIHYRLNGKWIELQGAD